MRRFIPILGGMVLTLGALVLAMGTLYAHRAQNAVVTAPVMVIETAKGVVEIRLFRADAPKSVDRVLDLVKRNFYRAQRIHRVEASLVQFGDPTTRDMSRMAYWGAGGFGQPIGVAEFNRHKHVRGSVGFAHGGNARFADSQLYIMKAASPSLDGKHVVIGQVTKGMAVVDRLQKADQLKVVSVKEAGRTP